MIFSWLLNTLYTLTPYLDFPAPPQDWGILGPFLHVVIASLSSHAQLLSVLSRLISPPPQGLMATHPTEMAMREGECFPPGNGGQLPFPQGMCPAPLGQSIVAINYFWGALGPPSSAHFWGK